MARTVIDIGQALRASKGATPRFFFGAIPARAIGDDRLSAVEFRLLTCVALHDRMTANHPATTYTCTMPKLRRGKGTSSSRSASIPALGSAHERGAEESEIENSDDEREYVVERGKP
jgi:hypothetical protein